MEKIYKISTLCDEEYIEIEERCFDSLTIISSRQSDFQYLTKEPAVVETSEDGGFEYPDYIWYPVPLISERFKRVLDNNGIDNVFYKPVYIEDELLEKRTMYWLAVFDAIECLDYEKSLKDEELEWSYEKVVINPLKTGRYKVFKCSEINEQDIFFKEDIVRELESLDLKGVRFDEI